MGKLQVTTFYKSDEIYGYMFKCPGCGDDHRVPVSDKNGPPVWQFNGDLNKPTFSPSLLIRTGHYVPGHQGKCWCDYNASHSEPAPFSCTVCHSFITDGNIQFLSDCTHQLAGQTIELPEVK